MRRLGGSRAQGCTESDIRLIHRAKTDDARRSFGASCWSNRRPLLPRRANDDAHSDHNLNIREIEDSRVQWSGAHNYKVGHQTVAQNSIKEIADPSGQNK